MKRSMLWTSILVGSLALGAGCKNDREKAIEVLGPYFEQTIPNRIKHLEADPDMDPIRDDPRFKDMLAAAKQRLGMADSPVASAKA